MELEINLIQGGPPLYDQIYGHIRDAIRTGELKTGERIPSTRSLASYLNIARSTVTTAYDQLLSEGYIESRPQRGYFVADLAGLDYMPFGRDEEDASPDTAALPAKGTGEEEHIDFSPRSIDLKFFPFSTWAKLTRSALTNGAAEMFSMGDAQGDLPLRATIARSLLLSRGVHCSPEDIVVGAGNDYLLLLLSRLLGEGRTAGMEYVSYVRASRVLYRAGIDVRPVTIDSRGMSVESLRASGADVAYVMPSHQFPTGIVMPVGRRSELLYWAAEKDRYIIEDDYDSEFRYRGRPIPPMKASDSLGKVIYLGTFSKSIAPAIRVSFMVLPRHLAEVFGREYRVFSSTVSRLDQRVLTAYIGEGYLERSVNRVRKAYRIKHDCLLESLRGLPPGYAIRGADAGLHLIVEEEEPAGPEAASEREREVALLAGKRGVRVYPVSDDLIDSARNLSWLKREVGKLKPAWVLGYAALDEGQIKRGTDIFRECLEEAPARRI